MEYVELNIDSLVGATHQFAGMADDNPWAKSSDGQLSNPKVAALQGLRKMKLVADLGVKQVIVPPPERPNIQVLRSLGFSGSDENVLRAALRDAPLLLKACSSASSMWTANMATLSPSRDTSDNRVHITPANLVSNIHRALETPFTQKILHLLFPDENYFSHHEPLPSTLVLGDEGAANHTRLCPSYEQSGIHFFVFGRHGFEQKKEEQRFKSVGRQSLEASQAIRRQHGISQERVVIAQQNPKAIDFGVFHNDVISTGNQNFFMYHELAFAETETAGKLKEKYYEIYQKEPYFYKVEEAELSLSEVLATYLFNSQIISVSDGSMVIIAPVECQNNPNAMAVIQNLLSDSKCPINDVKFVNVEQSLKNGGGPACLRLRIVLSAEELSQTHQGVQFTESLYLKLHSWVEKHYRDRFAYGDLVDPLFIRELREALDELTSILKLGSIYPFQMAAL